MERLNSSVFRCLTKVAPIFGIGLPDIGFAHIGIKYFVTNMADNVLLMHTPIIVRVDQFYCHVLIVHCLFVNHFRECFDDVKEEIAYWGLL